MRLCVSFIFVNLRLANVLHHTNISEDTLWNVVRKFRPFIYGLVYYAFNNLKFIEKDLFLGGSSCKTDVSNLVTAVGNYFRIESSDINYGNISGEKFKTAGNTFIYLFFKLGIYYPGHALDCPFIEYNNWFSSWSQIYKGFFETKSADRILLTLIRMMKKSSWLSSQGNVEDVLKRLATTLALKYDDIQNILPQKYRNSSIINDFQLFESSEGMPQCYVKIFNNLSFLHDHFQYLPFLTIQCTL